MRFTALLLTATLSAAAAMPAAAELPGDSVYQLSAQLTDQDGAAVQWRDQQGRAKLVSLFYADCRMTCPLIVQAGKTVQAQLSSREHRGLDLVLISLDPARDTPAVLADVAQRHRLDRERWTLLRPDADDVRAIAGVLGVRYRARDDGGFDHTSVLVLLDADGRILARTEGIGGAPDPGFLAQVRQAAAP